MPDNEDEAQAIHLHKILAVMFMMAAKMRHFGLEDDVSIHRVYYYLKLAENLVLGGERHVAQSFLDAAGSAGDSRMKMSWPRWQGWRNFYAFHSTT